MSQNVSNHSAHCIPEFAVAGMEIVTTISIAVQLYVLDELIWNLQHCRFIVRGLLWVASVLISTPIAITIDTTACPFFIISHIDELEGTVTFFLITHFVAIGTREE